MENAQIIITTAGVFFVFIFLSGVWLRRSGKPYSGLRLNIHKFFSLAALYYLGRVLIQFENAVRLNSLALYVSILAAVCFVVSIISGGLVSIEKEMPLGVRWLHKIAPYLTVVFTVSSLYVLLV